jgi:hypothetical protein
MLTERDEPETEAEVAVDDDEHDSDAVDNIDLLDDDDVTITDDGDQMDIAEQVEKELEELK